MTTLGVPRASAADRRGPHVVALLALAGCGYLALNDPNDRDALLPPCPTKLLTGLDCPACGGLRMVRALLYGDVSAAARANALLLALTPVAAVLWVVWARRARRGEPGGLRLSRTSAVVLLCVLAVWTVGRNFT